MVVARPHPVEQGGVDFHPERLTALPLDLQRKLDTAAAHLQAKALLVCQQLIFDDVTGKLAVQGDEFVAGKDAGPVRRRPGGHRDHSGEGHGSPQDRRRRWGAAARGGADGAGAGPAPMLEPAGPGGQAPVGRRGAPFRRG
jgi:hypothetical protein